MSAQIIDGKKISAQVRTEIAKISKNLAVTLAVIIVGENPASKIYVNNKKKACEEIGFNSLEYALPTNTTQQELLELIDELNKNKAVNGILVQMPLPVHINEQSVIEKIDPIKDVDAFHAVNVGKIMIGDFYFLPCTPAGVMKLLEAYNVQIDGKNCVVVGRSNIVGKPMSMLLLHKNATVTICHSHTQNLKAICRGADILVAAIGKAKFITADMVKVGAVVIDVGMNRTADGKLCGDVDFDLVKEKVSAITPVPGGVGPMTIAMLMQNTLTAAQIQNERK